MNFKKQVTIKSKFSKEIIWKRLHNISEPYNKKNTSSAFEGTISENSFVLYQLFDYGNGNFIRPKINGKLVQKNEYVELHLFFKLSLEMRILFGAAFSINTVLIIIQATTNWLADCILLPFGWKVHSIVILISYAIALLTYYNKVQACIKKFLALSNGKLIDNNIQNH